MKKQFVLASLIICISSYIAHTQPVIRKDIAAGGKGIDAHRSSAVTIDGGVIIGGSSNANASGDKSEDNRCDCHQTSDYWIVKFDKAGRIEWDKTLGGNQSDDLVTIQQTSDTGYIVAGVSRSDISGEKTENNRCNCTEFPSYDYWIVKVDRYGNVQWDKTVGGDNNDYLISVLQTKDQGFILGGYSYSNISGEKTQESRGGTDIWIVKLDSAGNIKWDKTIGGNGYDQLVDIQNDEDDGLLIGGISTSDISGEKSEQSRGGYDYWILEADRNGNILWDKTIGAYGADILVAFRKINNSYILAGTSDANISGEKSENNRGRIGQDYWIIKLDNNRNVEWDKTAGGNREDYLKVLQTTKDNGYILAGNSNSNKSGEKTENNRCGCITDYISDYWIVKIDSIGNVQWDKTVGGNGNDQLTSLKPDIGGGFIAAGYSYSGISGEKTECSRGGSDYWIVKLNNQGIVEWDKTAGGKQNDECHEIIVVKKHQYVAIGTSTTGGGDRHQQSRGEDDYWMVALEYTSPSIREEITLTNTDLLLKQKDIAVFTIYPNPAKDILHIQNTGKTTVTLTNQSGKILLTKTINGNGEMNVAHLPAGLYYLKNNETGVVQKIIITK